MRRAGDGRAAGRVRRLRRRHACGACGGRDIGHAASDPPSGAEWRRGPAGATAGRGYAIVALHHRSILCFPRFAHLHGFTVATRALIYTGTRRRKGSFWLTPGPRLHHQGCIRLGPVTWTALRNQPTAYTVELDSARFPAGAVRARL